jgi:hypothetical protein
MHMQHDSGLALFFSLLGRWRSLVFVLTPLLLAAPASAQPASKIGAATAVENEVEGRIGRAIEKLAVGSNVYRDQLVRTGKASTAALQFLDETNLSLSPSTEIRLDRYIFDSERKTGSVVLDVPRGVVRFITGTLESRNYTIRASFVTVGVRGTTFDVLVWPDRVTVLLIAGGVDLTLRPRRVFVLNEPNTAITIYRDGRVVGPRAWNGAVTDFANLAPPSPPAQRRAAATPARYQTASQPPAATGTGGANTAIERLGAGSTINTVGGGGVGFDGGGRRTPSAPCSACAPKPSGGTKMGGSGSAGGGGTSPSPRRGPDPNIDYGFAAPRPKFNPGDPK